MRPHQATSVIVFVVLAYHVTRRLFRLLATTKRDLKSRDEVYNNQQKQLLGTHVIVFGTDILQSKCSGVPINATE